MPRVILANGDSYLVHGTGNVMREPVGENHFALTFPDAVDVELLDELGLTGEEFDDVRWDDIRVEPRERKEVASCS